MPAARRCCRSTNRSADGSGSLRVPASPRKAIDSRRFARGHVHARERLALVVTSDTLHNIFFLMEDCSQSNDLALG